MTLLTPGEHASEANWRVRRETWLGVAIVIGVFVVMPFALAATRAIAGVDYGESLAMIALWCEPFLESFFSFAGIVTALLVALAIATRFGADIATLPKRVQVCLEGSVIAGGFGIAIAAGLTVVVAAVTPARWAEVFLVLVAAWCTTLVAMLVLGVVSLEEQARNAEYEWRSRRDRAAGYGVRRRDVVLVADRVGAAVIVTLAPLILWLAASGLLLFSLGARDAEFAQGMSMMTLMYLGNGLLTLAAWTARDLSAPAFERWWSAGVWGGLAMAFSASVAVFLIGHGLWPVGALLATFVVLHAIVLLMVLRPVPHLRLTPRFLRAWLEGETVESLRRTRQHFVKVRHRARVAARSV